jgi:hypothetical protein
VRSAIVTLLVATAVGAAVLGASWTVQAAALPAPDRADLIVARAGAWLSGYRFVESVFAVGGHRAVRARCLQTWVPATGGGVQSGTVLHFGRTGTIVVPKAGLLEVLGVAHGETSSLAVAQLELAGCPSRLGHMIEAYGQSLPDVDIKRVTVADRPAIGFGLPLDGGGRMEIYVTPRAYRPIALSLTAGRRYSGRSLIRLTQLTPALLRTFGGRR